MPTTGPLTLIDELALTQPTIRAGVIKTLVENVMLQDRIPWQTTGSKQVTATFLSGIPTVQLRLLNEAVGTRKANFAQLTEVLSIIDQDIDIDPVFMDEQNHVQNIQVAETEAVVNSVGYRINALFVNGDPDTDPREPKGIVKRLENDDRFNGQTVNATVNATKHPYIPGTATDAQILVALNGLDNLLYRIANGGGYQGIVLLSNQQFILATWANLRQIKMLDTTRDSFDREFVTYKGVPIIDMGFTETGAIDGTPAAAGQLGNQIIGHDSYDVPATNGANAYQDTTPVFAVKFADNFCVGLQQTPMKVEPYGKTDVSPHYIRTNLRWVIQPAACFQKRAIARYVGLDVSA
jgi:hypothetical protein